MAYFDKYGVEFSDDRKTLVKCPKDFQGEYVIPNNITSIGDAAFEDCYGLVNVEIPNSVTIIGKHAFAGCVRLMSLTIPNSVASIGDAAIWACPDLASIVVEAGNSTYDSRNNCNAIIETASNTLLWGCQNTSIPNSVNRIGEGAFYHCTGLRWIDLPDSVTSIEEWAFGNCEFTSIWIPNSVTRIGDSAFEHSALTSVIIPNSVINIGDGAFFGCSSLTNITIRDGVKSIGEAAFAYCVSLRYIEIPNSVESIGERAFEDCKGLTGITIHDGVKEIGNEAFRNCTSLTHIKIPSSIIQMGENVFIGCTDLNFVDEYGVEFSNNRKVLIKCPEVLCGEYVIPNGVTSIGESAFSGCSNLTRVMIPNNVTYIGINAFFGCKSLTCVEIPNSVTYVGNGAFQRCCSLTKVIIPGSIMNRGEDAFRECSQFRIFDEYGVEFSDDCRTLIKCPQDLQGAYSIPEGVEILERGSFQECNELTALSIPMSVHKIEQFAIRSCDKLTSLVIPDSITEIGNGNFSNLGEMRSIVIGNSVYYLENCFGSCSALCSIVGHDRLRLSLINDDLFETPWYQLHPKGAVIIGATFIKYKLSPNEQLKEYKLPDNVLYIASGAFDDCPELESIDFNNAIIVECSLPDGVSSIKATGNALQETESFDNTLWFKNHQSGCVNIGSLLYRYKADEGKYPRVISIPDNTIVINKKAFYALYQYTDETREDVIPFAILCDENLTTIGESAVEGSGISNIILFEKLVQIHKNAFSNSMLKAISLPESLREIGEEAFLGCKLTSISIPESITYIPKRAFYANKSLASVSFSPYITGVEVIGEEAFAECNIVSLYIPPTVREIDDKAFYNNYLRNLCLSEGVETIGYGVFASNQSADSYRYLELPSSIQQLGMAFWRTWDEEAGLYMGEFYPASSRDTNAVETLVINCDVNFFQLASVFKNNLRTVIINDGVTSIPIECFIDCENLKNVILPSTLQTIRERAFMGCESLETLVLPSSINELWAISLPQNIKKVILYSGKLLLKIGVRMKNRYNYFIENKVFVDANGNEIVPELMIYELGEQNDNGIFRFKGENYDIVKVDDFEDDEDYCELLSEADDNYDDRPSYSQYGGYNDFDDDTINSAFEGDPEATWNID